MSPIDWILAVSVTIGGLFGLLCLFEGVRRIAPYGANSASNYLIGIGAVICLALAAYCYWKYSEDGGAFFVPFVMWLVCAAAAPVFGALFARAPVPEPVAEVDTKIEPVLVPPVTVAAAPAAPPPPGAPKPAVGINTMPLAKPEVGGDTVPLPKPRVGEDTVPLPKPVAAPPAKSSVGEDTVPLPKPAPGSLTPPKRP